MSPKPILALAIALGLGRVASGEPLAIRTTGELSFTTAELETALALRAGLAGPDATRSIVAAVSGDRARVLVAVVGRQRDVPLDGQGGVDAARLVAFAILDLAGDQLDPPALASDAELARRAAALQPDEVIHVRPLLIEPYRPVWSLALWGLAGSQVGAARGGAVELGVPILDALRGMVSAGIDGRVDLGTGASLRTIPVRLGIAWRGFASGHGHLELRASAISVVLDASAMRGDTSVIFGAGGALLWSVPLGAGKGLTILAGGGVDGFATARDYRVDGARVGTTDRVAAWAGLGLAGELRR